MKQKQYSIFDNMLEGVQVIDKEFRYFYVNEAVTKHGKSTKEEMIGFTMMDKYPGIENTKLFTLINKCMIDRKASKLLNEFQFPDGSNGYFELRIQPVPEGVLILSIDVSEQKKLENKLLQFNEQLEEMVDRRTRELANALEREKKINQLKSRFVSTASHEFKTPLGAIELSVNVLNDIYNVPPNKKEREKYHKHIKTSVKNLHEVLNDFLSLDRLEQGNVYYQNQEFDLPQLVTLEIEKLKFLCKEDQKIAYKHIGNELVFMDNHIIRSILTNLLTNAIKYSEKDINVKSQVIKENFFLTIEDKGIGIPKDEQDELFSKFFRASNTNKIQGTGLGLNIVKQYTEMLNGNITITSAEGEGTKVRLQFPNKLKRLEKTSNSPLRKI
ncbi:MAG: PAS domain-containing protein [Flavobacteriales bacterium]|nr:PAS domain-containing protein [Flavobacteriales bacterium]